MLYFMQLLGSSKLIAAASLELDIFAMDRSVNDEKNLCNIRPQPFLQGHAEAFFGSVQQFLGHIIVSDFF